MSIASTGLPLPNALPGDFFVLEYQFDVETYKLHLDDGDGSSYDLGDDIPQMMFRFRLWGWESLGNKCIDMARSFGAVQGIFKDERTIALFQRKQPAASVFNKKQESSRVRNLPILRPTT